MIVSWAYIAGYFDGEGHVGFHTTKSGGKTRSLSWYNTHLISLEAMQDFMGVGRIVSRDPGSFNASNVPAGRVVAKKTQYILTISNKAHLIHALDNMIPYLIIKRDKCEELRKFVETIDDTGMVNFGKAAAVSTDQLVRWHHDEKKSHAEIAALIGVTRTSVSRELRKRGISQPVSSGGHTHPEHIKTRLSDLRKAQWSDPVWAADRRAAINAGIERKRRESGN